MVQLTKEQRTFITKKFYETESVNVVAIFTKLFIGIKECTNPLMEKICIFQFPTVLDCDFDWEFHFEVDLALLCC